MGLLVSNGAIGDSIRLQGEDIGKGPKLGKKKKPRESKKSKQKAKMVHLLESVMFFSHQWIWVLLSVILVFSDVRLGIVPADMAHGVHPNFMNKHEEHHRPEMHKGLVIKHNANQRYATSGVTSLLFKEVAKLHNLPTQTDCMLLSLIFKYIIPRLPSVGLRVGGGLFPLKKKIEDVILRAEMLAPTALEREEARRILQEEVSSLYFCNAEEAKLIAQLVEIDGVNYSLFEQHMMHLCWSPEKNPRFRPPHFLFFSLEFNVECLTLFNGRIIWLRDFASAYVCELNTLACISSERRSEGDRMVEKNLSMNKSATIKFDMLMVFFREVSLLHLYSEQLLTSNSVITI
ncbi:hypothetical protein F3Y22_tig00111105pilonHSYRG00809 [Hibiscus syriacus]|uniref:aspartyl aminopeptidase n=1 Tax=Hibiscus syriacus TaxID=106335 RepID=A0A6A2Z0I0_HIBSY|nr:hypothetical protein F3Y22_tig00111105pilonHSYRG00809 [Hibiscus syriacus]